MVFTTYRITHSNCAAHTLCIFKNRNSLTRLNDVRNKIRSHKAFEYWFFPLVSWILSVLFPYFLFLTMVSIILLSGIGFSKGAEVARDELKYYRECENSLPLTYGRSTLTENGRVVARGKIVARSGTHVAIFTRGITTVFPLESIIVEVHYAPLK